MVSALALAQREELAEVEEQIKALEQQLLNAQKEESTLQACCDCPDPEATRCRQPSLAPCLVGPDEGADDGLAALGLREQLEAEIQIMEHDVCHCREQLAHLHNSERLRMQELDRLSHELTQAAERLAYEQQTVRTHENCLNAICTTRSSPNLIGPRTIELRAEQRLKELAVRRTGKLSNEVMRQAVDASIRQTTVDALSMKLLRVRSTLLDKDRELLAAQKATAGLQSRLVLGAGGGFAGGPADRCSGKALPTSGSTRSKTGKNTGVAAPRKAAQSTGRLPKLSF